MAIGTIEDRVQRLERSVETLLAAGRERDCGNWLDLWFGAFRDNPEFDAAIKRGEEYRRSQPTAADLMFG